MTDASFYGGGMAVITALSNVLAEVRTVLPCGGQIHLRLDTSTDSPYLLMQQVSPDEQTDEDADNLPEDYLGVDLCQRLDAAINAAVAEGTLPDYRSGEKYHDLRF